MEASPYIRENKFKTKSKICKVATKGGDDAETDAKPVECSYSAYAKYAMIAIIAILILIIVYKAYLSFTGQDSFIVQTIKTGPEMDFDIEDEITQLRNMQEDNLAKLANSI